MKRERRSAKDIVTKYANELLSRSSDKDATTKLLAVEAIAFRMGWNDLYNKLRFKSGIHEPETPELKWWQK